MQTLHPYSIFHLGDSALTIDFGNVIDDAVNRKVLRLFAHLQQRKLNYVIDMVPAYSSLTVYYDVMALKKLNSEQTAFDTMSDSINAAAIDFTAAEPIMRRMIEVPVCYSQKFAPDLDAYETGGITAEELVRLHTSKTYRVYMLGFLPGFAYMAEVDPKLEMPRKPIPRLNVAAGSVGIAGRQTGIYPFESPGGWQIIGRTPLTLFDKTKEDPAAFHPGDEIKFYSISEDEFANYQGRNS